ncbi:MAG: ADP-ribosylglycohydrolase family protein [Armatimonadota bacterium]|nr:ADP-ribosylglycohydrolase family protein [Armatimonadota bacterium]
MLRLSALVAAVLTIATAVSAEVVAYRQFRCIPISEYRDKMKAGWIGQIAGVSWGAPTEFRFRGKIIPEEKMPKWTDDTINNAFGQDDLYVEMTFLRSLEQYGLGVSQEQAGLDFAASKYKLWHANKFGRDNLRKGIAPPDSGHPKFNSHADDIDFQIEADFSGLVAPGLPNMAISLGEKFGRLMNYGDGLYGGQFVGGMYAEAFFESDPVKIVEAGLKCIPLGSQYAETIRDVLRWHRLYPNDWEKTWNLIEQKYQSNAAYRRFSCDTRNDFNIDAKINGAYIVTGLLYGAGDPDKTITIAARCGQDSDCNPSNAAGVLFTTIGYSNLPARFKARLDESRVFSYTAYSFPKLVAATEKVARQAVIADGGMIASGPRDEDYLVIPVQNPIPGKLQQCWKPGPAPGVSGFEGRGVKPIGL